MAMHVGMIVVMPVLMMIVYFDRHDVDPAVPNFRFGHQMVRERADLLGRPA